MKRFLFWKRDWIVVKEGESLNSLVRPVEMLMWHLSFNRQIGGSFAAIFFFLTTRSTLVYMSLREGLMFWEIIQVLRIIYGKFEICLSFDFGFYFLFWLAPQTTSFFVFALIYLCAHHYVYFVNNFICYIKWLQF